MVSFLLATTITNQPVITSMSTSFPLVLASPTQIPLPLQYRCHHHHYQHRHRQITRLIYDR
jgi:hypothetical protein